MSRASSLLITRVLAPVRQAAAAAEPVGSLLLERQLVGRVDGLAAAPASRADGPRQQRGRLLDGVQRLYKVRNRHSFTVSHSLKILFFYFFNFFFLAFSHIRISINYTLKRY